MEELKEELREELKEDHLNENLDQFRIKGLNEALDFTKEKDEKIRTHVDCIYKLMIHLLKSDEENEEDTDGVYDSVLTLIKGKHDDLDILDMFSILSKVSLYLAQSYFDSKEQFDDEYKVARKLVTENILQSLGINSFDDEKNASSVVTFNGTPDLENFSLRRILMLSSQITEYAIWQLTLTRTFDKLSSENAVAEEEIAIEEEIETEVLF